MFTYPVDAQVDVPLGTRIVVTFSDPVEASALGACSGQGASVTGGFCLVGPNGVIDTMPEIVADGTTVQLSAPPLEAGTAYSIFVGAALAPTAANLPASGPLFSFTTRSERPRAAPPKLIAVNGADPTKPDAFRPMLDSSTIRLVFSEPLDPRTVMLGAGSIELAEMASGTAVPATIVAKDIHVSIDPIADLHPGTTYVVRLGNQIADLGGQTLAPTAFTLVPEDTRGAVGPIHQVLRTKQPTDPGGTTTRTGVTPNSFEIDKPLIGKNSAALQPSAIAVELGDPKVLDGPLAFTVRRGQRLKASGLDVKLGGTLPSGLSTGDIQIEFLTDAGGRLYRNPHQPADQRPENLRAPLYVDLSLDIAIYATDPTGNAVLAQTILGVQAAGTVSASDGQLVIETAASMDLGLLGVTSAPTNLVLTLVTDATATVDKDTTPPGLVASFPADGTSEMPIDGGIELIFNEPIDLDRARAGGVELQDAANKPIASVIESHGAAIVVRPLVPLANGATYHVVLADVADVAGNPLGGASPITVSTPKLAGTTAPVSVVAVHPGAPCALTGGNATSPGRCAGGNTADDAYHPFTLPADEAVEVAFTQAPNPATIVRGVVCNAGSVRVEEIDGAGACVAAVPGTLLQRSRSFGFVPDVPWDPAKHYRLTVVSGGNQSCNAGEVCGVSGDAASFDPLGGTLGGGSAGGPNLVIDFVATPPDGSTFVFAEATPFTDVNGSGTIDTDETRADDNRAALRITGTSGAVSSASFNAPDCIPATPEVEGCMYLLGAMPVEMGALAMNCTLPDGTTAPSCVPVTLSPEAMYATSLAMNATAVISISTNTGTSVMRIREPATGPVTGYIIDKGGMPTLVVQLDLYMDAPDMTITLSSHDLHSKPLSLMLEGAVRFLPDGRIAIAASNVADVPISVNINAPLGISGAVNMILPKGEMKLQLVSRPIRGASL